jgi:predicted outer membrane repeat protein
MGRRMAVVAAAGVAALLAGVVMPTAASAQPVMKVPCSTPALVNAISGAADGATLDLASRCTYVLTAALPTVAQDLTINGNGSTLRRSTATGTAAFTILTITAGTVTLNLLSFTNGAGAITVDNLAQLTVTGGEFSRNTAVNGAAINNTGATVVQVTDTSFVDNTATEDGGAIYVYTALGNQIIDCSFRGNTAAGSGGAYWEFSNGSFISGSTFRDNKATSGGALFFDDQGTEIAGTEIHDNRATGDGGGIEDESGGSPVYITASEITGNRAGGTGGGLDEESYGLGYITNTTIEDNRAADGGGINDGDGTIIEYTSDTISGNRASGAGGGVNAIVSSLIFTGTTISGNEAGGDGGGLYDSTGFGIPFTSFTNSTISSNRARGLGGGIYNQGPVDASGTQITGNRADGGGGGIYDAGTQATVTLTDSSPTGNKPDNCEPLGSITGCTG